MGCVCTEEGGISWEERHFEELQERVNYADCIQFTRFLPLKSGLAVLGRFRWNLQFQLLWEQCRVEREFTGSWVKLGRQRECWPILLNIVLKFFLIMCTNVLL